MTLIEILQLLIPFKANITTASHVRSQLKDVDLETMIADLRTKEVVREIKPLPNIMPNNPNKEFYHAINSAGRRCFDEHRRREREQGFIHPDAGTTFPAKHSSGHCEECGELIIEGDLMAMRARAKKSEQG